MFAKVETLEAERDSMRSLLDRALAELSVKVTYFLPTVPILMTVT